jgi:hypothetical protein
MTEQAQQVPEVTLQDIQMTIEVIDLASSRGAIKGAEMSQVGALRYRMASFLQYQQEVAKQQEQASNAKEKIVETQQDEEDSK